MPIKFGVRGTMSKFKKNEKEKVRKYHLISLTYILS